VVTRQELREELRGYATKEDLKRFATKEDLKRFATKEDLKRFATKEDLEEWGERILRQTRMLFEDFRAEIRAWIDGVDVRDQVKTLERRVDDNESRLDSAELRLTAVEGRTPKG
jgi:glutaredoxin 2